MNSISRFIFPVAAVFWTAVVFYVCLMPSSDVPTVWWMDFPLADKLVHIVLFGIMCWLYCKTVLTMNSLNVSKGLLIAASLSIAIGVLIECLQAWLANGRSFEITDILADALASVLVTLMVYQVRRSNKN